MTRLLAQRKDLMKNGIYEATVAILTRHGFDAMTMDRVADEAGVAKGSLYNYFPNKLKLLEFVYEKTIEPLRQGAVVILEAELPAVRKLESLIKVWYEHLGEHRGLFNFLFNDYTVLKLLESRETGRKSAIRDLAKIIEQGVAEHNFRQVDPNQAAVLLFGIVREMADQQLATNEAWPINDMTNIVMDFTLVGLGTVNERTGGGP